MSSLLRFGVSVEEELLTSFDRLIGQQGYATRSEALADLMRDALVKARLAAQPDDAEIIGTLTLVYDHHAHGLTARMTDLQHDYDGLVISVLHVHLSHDDCLEVLVLRGEAQAVRALSDALLSLKGVKHGRLFTTFPAQTILTAEKKTSAKPAHSHSPPPIRKLPHK